MIQSSGSHDFPQPQEMFGLTNWVELVAINSICSYNPRNQFDIMRTPFETPVRSAACGHRIAPSMYNPYIATLQTTAISLKPINWSDLVLRNTIYFFMNQTIVDCVSNHRLWELYNLRYGSPAINSKYITIQGYRFPPQMPSRGKIFR